MSLSEALTRARLIGPQLRAVGWNLDDRTQIRFEVPVDGYDAEPWHGVTDYCLYTPSGEVISVIEAKRTSRNPREGEEQLRYYITEIAKKQCFPPFGFMSNGRDTFFWEPNLGRAIFDSHLFRMRVDTARVHPPYLSFVLNSGLVADQLSRMARGAIMEGLNTTILRECVIPLPSLNEQQQIAGLLEEADRLRHTRRYTLELSDTFLSAVFLEMFGDPLLNPKGWPEYELAKIVSPEKFAIVDGPFGSELKAEEYTDFGVRVIRVNNIQPTEFNFADVRYISTAKYETIIRSTVRPWDLVMAKVGNTIGKTCVFPDTIPFAVLTANVCKITLDLSVALPVFVTHQMNLDGIQARVIALSGDTAKPMINIPKLRQLKLILPPLSLQKKFTSLVERHERLRAGQREALRQAEHLFQTLLHQAFAAT